MCKPECGLVLFELILVTHGNPLEAVNLGHSDTADNTPAEVNIADIRDCVAVTLLSRRESVNAGIRPDILVGAVRGIEHKDIVSLSAVAVCVVVILYIIVIRTKVADESLALGLNNKCTRIGVTVVGIILTEVDCTVKISLSESDTEGCVVATDITECKRHGLGIFSLTGQVPKKIVRLHLRGIGTKHIRTHRGNNGIVEISTHPGKNGHRHKALRCVAKVKRAEGVGAKPLYIVRRGTHGLVVAEAVIGAKCTLQRPYIMSEIVGCVVPINEALNVRAVGVVHRPYRTVGVLKRILEHLFKQGHIHIILITDGKKRDGRTAVANELPVVAGVILIPTVAASTLTVEIVIHRCLEAVFLQCGTKDGTLLLCQIVIQPVIADGNRVAHLTDIEVVIGVPVLVACGVFKLTPQSLCIFLIARNLIRKTEIKAACQGCTGHGKKPDSVGYSIL